jgi:iron complex outermembrane receptor protein
MFSLASGPLRTRLALPSAGRIALPLFALSTLSAAMSVHAQTQAPNSMLPPVVVTATRFAEDAASLPFGVSVLTADDIRNAGASTVNEAMMKLLGVPGRLDFYGGGDYALDLRGFGVTADSNQVVVLDGVRLSEADLGGTRLAGIPIDSIDRIEVIRGSAAVRYGEGATGGAIIITTKGASGKARESSGYGYVAMGSNALFDARAGASLISGGFSLDVSGNKRESDGHRDNFKSDVEGLSLTGQWRNDWLRVGVRSGQDELHTGLPGSLTNLQYEANPRQTTHPTEHADIDNHRHGVFGGLTLGNWQVDADVDQRQKTLQSFSPSFNYSYDIDARTKSIRARHSAPMGAFANAFVIGYDRNEWTRAVTSAFGATSEQVSKAVYATDDLTLPGGTRLSAGVRNERANKSSTDTTVILVDERFNAWEVGVVQPFAQTAAVFAKLGRSFRFGNADEIGFTSLGGALRPQTSRDLDFGARWNYSMGRAELRFYRNALHDEIGYNPDAPNTFGPGANINLDPTVHHGVELEAFHVLNRAVQLRLNAALRNAKFTEGVYDGKDLALTPRRSISLGADWNIGGGHKLNGRINTVSSQYATFSNACSMPSYTTADAKYAFQAPNIELALGVTNLADKKYYTQAFSCANGAPSSIYPEAGRSLVASIRVGF